MHSSEIFLVENLTSIHRKKSRAPLFKVQLLSAVFSSNLIKRKSKNLAFYLTSQTDLHKPHKTLAKTHTLLLGSQARLCLRIHKTQIFTIQEETDTWSRTLTGKSKPIRCLMWYFTPNLTIFRTASGVPYIYNLLNYKSRFSFTPQLCQEPLWSLPRHSNQELLQ